MQKGSTHSENDRDYLLRLQNAIKLQEQGSIEAAEELFKSLLVENPDHYLALNFMGALEFEYGNALRGEALIRKSIKSHPTHWAARNNLGNILLLQNKLQEAEVQYEQAVKYKPDALDPLLNLGSLAIHNKKLPAAAGYYHKAYEIAGNHPKVVSGLARLFEYDGQVEKAVVYYQELVDRFPNDLRHLHALASMYLRCRQVDKAIETYQKILGVNPNDPEAAHMLAALTGEQPPDKASPEYVSELFDKFASSFDNVLKSLEYRAPGIVGQKAADRMGDTPYKKALDAGCGTGLCASYLRSLSVELIGIDLSAGMLKRANALSLYNQLHHVEIVSFLRQKHLLYDLIVSADTLNYFGDLSEVFQVFQQSLQTGAEVIFTLECLDDNDEDFQLQPHGRYSHSDRYIRNTLKESNLQLTEMNSVVLRMESGQPVQGYLVVASKLD